MSSGTLAIISNLFLRLVHYANPHKPYLVAGVDCRHRYYKSIYEHTEQHDLLDMALDCSYS